MLLPMTVVDEKIPFLVDMIIDIPTEDGEMLHDKWMK